MQYKTIKSFRRHCLGGESVSEELDITLNNVNNGEAHIVDLFPYFLKHARELYPHISCVNELEKISDLTTPAYWYPSARQMKRKIIFHAGPTNSGKTYQAMQRFLKAKTGVYCGPLRLLAVEVFNKTNEQVCIRR